MDKRDRILAILDHMAELYAEAEGLPCGARTAARLLRAGDVAGAAKAATASQTGAIGAMGWLIKDHLGGPPRRR